jgi:hypothetical protein
MVIQMWFYKCEVDVVVRTRQEDALRPGGGLKGFSVATSAKLFRSF